MHTYTLCFSRCLSETPWKFLYLSPPPPFLSLSLSLFLCHTFVTLRALHNRSHTLSPARNTTDLTLEGFSSLLQLKTTNLSGECAVAGVERPVALLVVQAGYRVQEGTQLCEFLWRAAGQSDRRSCTACQHTSSPRRNNDDGCNSAPGTFVAQLDPWSTFESSRTYAAPGLRCAFLPTAHRFARLKPHCELSQAHPSAGGVERRHSAATRMAVVFAAPCLGCFH